MGRLLNLVGENEGKMLGIAVTQGEFIPCPLTGLVRPDEGFYHRPTLEHQSMVRNRVRQGKTPLPTLMIAVLHCVVLSCLLVAGRELGTVE